MKVATLEKIGYKLVYKSGHGSVWCDGHIHVHSRGGSAACYDQNPVDVIQDPFRWPSLCDCHKYQKI